MSPMEEKVECYSGLAQAHFGIRPIEDPWQVQVPFGFG